MSNIACDTKFKSKHINFKVISNCVQYQAEISLFRNIITFFCLFRINYILKHRLTAAQYFIIFLSDIKCFCFNRSNIFCNSSLVDPINNSHILVESKHFHISTLSEHHITQHKKNFQYIIILYNSICLS